MDAVHAHSKLLEEEDYGESLAMAIEHMEFLTGYVHLWEKEMKEEDGPQPQ